MAVDDTKAAVSYVAAQADSAERKPRHKRPVYDVLAERTAGELKPDTTVLVVLAEKHGGASSSGKAVDAEREKLGKDERFGLFYTVRHGELVEHDRPDPNAALLDDLVAKLQELAPDADPDRIREQARLAVEQNGGTS